MITGLLSVALASSLVLAGIWYKEVFGLKKFNKRLQHSNNQLVEHIRQMSISESVKSARRQREGRF